MHMRMDTERRRAAAGVDSTEESNGGGRAGSRASTQSRDLITHACQFVMRIMIATDTGARSLAGAGLQM